MSERIRVLDPQSLEQLLRAPGVLVVDFWAEWCGPCRMLAPVMEQLAEKLDGKITVGKINVDDHGALGASYGVLSIPTLLVFKDGQEVERLVGLRPLDAIVESISAYL